MSDPFRSQGEPLTNRKSLSSGWQRLLEMGEDLHALNHSNLTGIPGPGVSQPRPGTGLILSAQEIILAGLADLSGGQVELWLSNWLGEELGCDEPGLFSDAPQAALAQKAFYKRQVCSGKAGVKAFELAMPLISPVEAELETPVLGVITFRRNPGAAFRKPEVDLLKRAAKQVVITIEDWRRMAADQRRAAQLATITEVGNAITSILNEEELLQQVVDLIHERFHFPFVHLFSVHPGRRKIFYEAGSGGRSQSLAGRDFAYDLDSPQGLIPWVAQHGETALVNDITQDERYRPAQVFPDETQAELAIPLCFGKEVLGVLDIQSDRKGAFGSQEQFLFEALADSIAIAMRNASLFRSERWRRQVADSLREVAGLLSAEVDLEQVLDATLIELERNLPCDLAAIWFLEEEAGQDNPVQMAASLRLASVRGAGHAWLMPQVGLNLGDILELEQAAFDGGAGDKLPAWLLEALRSDQPVTRASGLAMDRLATMLEFPGDYSAVAAPLRIGEQRLGLLMLLHQAAGRYGGEARAMTAAFASYASVAIQNTRLYESAHEQIWVSTVLLQVAEATQSIDDLNELTATVVSLTPMLVGVKACAIYLCNEDGVFFPASASGLLPEAQTEFERRRFSPGDLPALDALWMGKHATILQRQGDDLRLVGLFPPVSPQVEPLELLVLVPLAAHGDILGALFVQYTSDPLKTTLQTLENFFEQKLLILQGLAHQTATAIENMHLLKSQKEEAYVSVALLQVAQAVVSSSDLDESLESIVRITPILTGVKRVAIYLYDSKTEQLQLTQSYGLPRSANAFPLGLDEFPLLEAAIRQDRLATYPLNPVMDDQWEDVPENWTYLPAPENDEVQEFLKEDTRLLIALPLSVKGEVLGALLVEEPDLLRGVEDAGSRSNLRLRSKRLEITTGISQQAALAIQNSLLKREMAERERLEREMQLAREIQTAFLPSEMPDLPGWEVNVWWRTAREMGGDFYDIFRTPNGCLGVVMADVADKGMPAALFMILVRALVRATMKDSLSPAEALFQVNDLLVPDAHGGTFVTLFYANLDLQSGELRYANAGQNPPLWVRRQEQAIEQLTKTGMALGVQEGIVIEERSIILGPGDYLVTYTDGVTDTFSPDGELFGLDCLVRSAGEAAFSEGGGSAQGMLQALDARIEDFTHHAPAIDDSTMLVLYRRL